MFPVVEPEGEGSDGRVRGCLFVRTIRDIPRERWDEATVGDLLRACTEENSVRPDEDAMAVLERMKASGNRRFLVLENDRLAGVLTLKDLLDFLALKLEFDEGLPPEEAEAEAATP
jgi:CBS domain-containing protein